MTDAVAASRLSSRMAKRHVTLRDVADVCGLSFKTVSRVLNDEPNVRADTREKVLEAARSLNYHPHMAARSLVARRNFLVGLLFENPSPNYVLDLQMGSLERLKDERYRLLTMPIGSYQELKGRIVSLVRSAGLDGVILSPPISDDPAVLEELESAGVPFVRIASVHDGLRGPQIASNDLDAAREMTDYLIELGHRRIGFIKGDPTHRAAAVRYQGFCEAMAAAGLPIDPRHVREGAFTFASGHQAAAALFAGGDHPTAVFASNDDMAAGCLIAAYEAGLSVPDDVSVVGYDDSQVAQIVWPRLTTVRQPTAEMARAATDILLSILSDQPHEENVDFGHDLVVRSSAGPVQD